MIDLSQKGGIYQIGRTMCAFAFPVRNRCFSEYKRGGGYISEGYLAKKICEVIVHTNVLSSSTISFNGRPIGL